LDVRDRIVIATKVSAEHFAPADLRAACERSLRRLRTDRIDLYQLHWPRRDLPLAETLGVLDALRTEGKIRAFGVSNFGPQDLAQGLASGHRAASNQVAYNLLFRAIEFEILPQCVKENVSVLCYCPLMEGLLTGKFASPEQVPPDRARTRHFACRRPHTRHGELGAEAETFAAVEAVRSIAAEIGRPMSEVSLGWLLAQRGITSVIAGGRNAEQARANAAAADLTLPADIVNRLSRATDPLKRKLGPNADLLQGDPRVR